MSWYSCKKYVIVDGIKHREKKGMIVMNMNNKKFENIIKYLDQQMQPVETLKQLDAKKVDALPGVTPEESQAFMSLIDAANKRIKNLETQMYKVIWDAISKKERLDVKSISLDGIGMLYEWLDKEHFILILNDFQDQYEKEMKQYENISIPRIPIRDVFENERKGMAFIRFCESQGYMYLHELHTFDFYNEKIRGIGNETLLDLKHVFDSFVKQNISKESILKRVHENNYNIKIKDTIRFGFSPKLIDKYDLYEERIIALKDIDIEYEDLFSLDASLKFFSQSMVSYFWHSYQKIKPMHIDVMLQRLEGKTLENIGRQFNITRERTRQICKSVHDKLKNDVVLLVDMIIVDASVGIESAQILQTMHDTLVSNLPNRLYDIENMVKIIEGVLKNSDTFMYLAYAKKYIRKDQIPKNYFATINAAISDHLEAPLLKYELYDKMRDFLFTPLFINEEQFYNYVKELGYKVYGDLIINRGATINKICHDAINRYFTDAIKLDDDPNNSDMRRLRDIINTKYQGLRLPHDNRALTSAITRNFENMILCDRGKYCPVEKVFVESAILKDIHTYIINNECATLYYSDIYESFRERLHRETNIDNYHFLHGVLKSRYHNDFDFARDFLTKKGFQIEKLDNSIVSLLQKKGSSVTYKELKNKFPGLTKLRISFLIDRVDNFFQYDTNEFNIIDNIKGIDQPAFDEIIEDALEENNGYISAKMIFDLFTAKRPEFLDMNNMDSAMKLYYILQTTCRDKYRFKYPHITSKDRSYHKLNSFEIAKTQLNFSTYFNFEEYAAFARRVGWANSTTFAFMEILEREYIKLSKNQYILRKAFYLNASTCLEIQQAINDLMQNKGFVAFNAIEDFHNFPTLEYDWNLYLLSSIIENYLSSTYSIIAPVARNRWYARGIVVANILGIRSYEDFIIMLLKWEERSFFTEKEIISILNTHGITYHQFPREMLEYSSLRKVGRMYYLTDETEAVTL